MTAAPFKAVLKFQTSNGDAFQYPCTVSDANNEYYVFPDGNNDVVLPSNRGAVIALAGVILSAAGTDTSKADIYVNGKATGEQIMNAANLTTTINPQFAGSPVKIAAGGRLRIKQLT